MNEKIARLLNEQINKEFYSAYLYLAISNYYDKLDLDGYANYYMIQAQEERDHALLFLKYMQNNGLEITFKPIDKPDQEFDSILQPLEMAAEHERYVTALINAIYHECHEAKDYRTMKFLDWFVDEQMEEEENALAPIPRDCMPWIRSTQAEFTQPPVWCCKKITPRWILHHRGVFFCIGYGVSGKPRVLKAVGAQLTIIFDCDRVNAL